MKRGRGRLMHLRGPLKTEKASEVMHFTSPFLFYGHRRPRLSRTPSSNIALAVSPGGTSTPHSQKNASSACWALAPPKGSPKPLRPLYGHLKGLKRSVCGSPSGSRSLAGPLGGVSPFFPDSNDRKLRRRVRKAERGTRGRPAVLRWRLTVFQIERS